MGLTAARKVLDGGHPLFVFDVAPKARERARSMGATVVERLSEVATNSEIVLMLLPGPREVEASVAGPDGLLTVAKPGSVIVDMSTVDPGTTRRMAQLTLEKQVGYLDAPVLGRPAAVGQWALPVGGEPRSVERCRPVFELFATRIFHVGESGTGHKIKLLNQLMFGAINAMTAEMMAVAESVGVSPKLLYETITASQAGTVSNLFKELGGRIAAENYSNPTFSVDLLVKDVGLALQMAKDHNAPPLLAQLVDFINQMAQAQGLGSEDTSIMWKSHRKMWARSNPDIALDK